MSKNEALAKAETMYTASTGCTVFINGERGTTTGLNRTFASGTIGAVVKLDERDATLYVMLGPATDSFHHEILSWREVTRDEFDAIMGVGEIRKSMGWVA